MKNALISVYYKDGLLEIAQELIKRNFNLFSTGGTYTFLKENGFAVTKVEDITQFPEVLGGRVKTLHPAVFSGILAMKDNEEHQQQMAEHNLLYFDLVYVTLYPFQKTISQENVTKEEAIEQIDIGGVSLIRAAAKNFKYVNVITDPLQFKKYFETYDINNGSIPEGFSMELASEAFRIIEEYDFTISGYFSKLTGKDIPLRYGENPHQKAKFTKTNFDDIFEVIHGKQLSYNNLLDVDAAHSLIMEFENDKPTAAIIKHGNPCGVAVRSTLTDAYKKAFECDTVSPFGGIFIFNKKLDLETAEECDKIFSEIILAPDYDDNALELLTKKKNRRLLKFRFYKPQSEFKSITGGILGQQRNNIIWENENISYPTVLKPTENDMRDLYFANKIVKHTKSNAVVFVKNMQTLGIGGGQPSRIDSTKIAISKAEQFGMELKGSAAASDAFFPFSDGLIAIADVGATCIVQPGGSVRDEEVIKAANDKAIAMIFTGIRHFRH